MILHIPHSSTDLHDYKFHLQEDQLNKMTDWFTDELFTAKDAKRVVFPYSRLICDVERFEDDSQEPMSRFGMGVCYEKTTEGQALKEVSFLERLHIINTLYRPHHQKLYESCQEDIQTKGEALLIDCHSFPDKAYYFNSDYNQDRVDICLGTDSYHTPANLINYIQNYFLSKGFTVAINKPYVGTIIPLKHYHTQPKLFSIMIEINRRLYLDENYHKNKKFSDLQEALTQLLEHLGRNRVTDL